MNIQKLMQQTVQSGDEDELRSSIKYGGLQSSFGDKRRLLISSVVTDSSVESQFVQSHGLPLHRAVIVVACAALGAGLLNFPDAYEKTGGLVNALSLQTVLVFLIIGSFFILGYCGFHYQVKNYEDMVKVHCGPVVQVICQINIILYMFGSNVTHMILIGDQLTKVIDQPAWYFDRKIVITVACVVFILPLCIPEKLRLISYSSLLGGFSAVSVCIVVVFRYYIGGYAHNNDISTKSFTFGRMLATVPVICFAFQSHVAAVAVHTEIHRPTVKRFGLVVLVATMLCYILYSLTGCFGYLTFQSNVNSDILNNYHHGDILVDFARIFTVLVIFSTFANFHFVGRSAVIGLWLKLRMLTPAQVQNYKNCRRVMTSFVWFFSCLGIALVVPTISNSIAILGSLAAHFIFTFPGVCLIQQMLQEEEAMEIKRKLGIILGVVYVVLGVFVFASTITLAIYTDLQTRG